MQAITQIRYGDPERLELREIEAPTPGAGEVLLRVAASSINAGDVAFLTGKPFRSYISTPKKPDLERLAALLAEGKVRPHITARRPLREVPAALREQMRGHARGKTVIVVPGE